jgi:vancomycin permeability regulator SanA
MRIPGVRDVAGLRRRRLPRALRIGVVVALAGLTAAVAAGTVTNLRMTADADARSYDDIPAVPARTVAIVFGAFVGADGVPSPALVDRLRAGVDL